MLCTGLFPNADTKIQHRRSPTCPLWYDKYQLCTIWLNYVYFRMWFKYRLKAQKLQKQHALKVSYQNKAPLTLPQSLLPANPCQGVCRYAR